ncbi:MAG: O-antigen ligase family protein [Filifactoraceae bacterium]
MSKDKGVKEYSKSRDKISESLGRFLPIIIVLAIIPLIIRLKVQAVSGQDMSYALGDKSVDLLSDWKSIWIMIVATAMVFLGFIFYKKDDSDKSKFIKNVKILLLVFGGITVISALLSSHKTLVWWGQYGQRRGLFTIISYIVICMYSMSVYRSKKDIRYILLPLSFLAILEGVILISQFAGNDLIFSDFVKSFIIPKKYESLRDAMELTIEGKAYGTFFNPNYVGSFVALLVPIFVLTGIKAKDIRLKLTYLFVVLLLFLGLFASGSRAGIIGVILSLVVAFFISLNSILKRPKMMVIAILVSVVTFAGINMLTEGLAVERVKSMSNDVKQLFLDVDKDVLQDSVIKDVYVKDQKLSILLDKEKVLNFTIDSSDQLRITDEVGTIVDYKTIDKYIIPSTNLADIRLKLGSISYENEKKNLYSLEINKERWLLFSLDGEELVIMDGYGNPITIEKAKSIGFKGKETLGSNRGYIWSRSLPILKESLLFGVGPDAFVAEFPHGDVVVRSAVYKTSTIKVDKPHNLYLQIGITQGIVALLVFLVLNGMYIANSFKIYFKKEEYSFHDVFGIGIMLGIVGYLGAGMFNDSVVSVAPLYWCLLGIGIAVNNINQKDVMDR